MEQTSPIQALLQQRTLLQLEYYTEKEAFRKLTEQIGMRRTILSSDDLSCSFRSRIIQGKFLPMLHLKTQRLRLRVQCPHLKTQYLCLKVQRLPLLLPIPRALNISLLLVRSAMWMVTEW